MQVGIAIVTTGHRQLPEYNTPRCCQFLVFEDTHLRGPAWARNQALRLLEGSGCTHMLVFDDDYAPRGADILRVCKELDEFGVDYAEVYGGRVTFQTKRALQVIGGYAESHGRYGLERAGRTIRARRAGLIGKAAGASTLSAAVVPLSNGAPLLSVEEKEAHIEAARGLYAAEAQGSWFVPYKPNRQ